MKHKLLSALFATILFISGCSAPKLIDGPDPSLLTAPIEFNLQSLSNRAIAALYEYSSSDDFEVEKCTNSEVDINLDTDPASKDSYPETMVIAKGKSNSYLIRAICTRASYEYTMSEVLGRFEVNNNGELVKNITLNDFDYHSSIADNGKDRFATMEGLYGGYKMDASMIWYVDSHEEYSDNPNRNEWSDIIEVSILYTKS